MGLFIPRHKQTHLTYLTLRERECLDELLKGKSNPEIAVALSIADKTVKGHLSVVYKFFGVRDRTQCVVEYNKRLTENAEALRQSLGR